LTLGRRRTDPSFVEFARPPAARRHSGAPRIADPRPAESLAAGQSPASLLDIQRSAGNAAATALVQRARAHDRIVMRQPILAERPTGAGREEVILPERPTLRFGSTGEIVKLLQMKLRNLREREHDRDPETRRARIDGIFGPLTRQDVIEFQADTGLDPDGVAGPRTWHTLESLVPETPIESEERAADDTFFAAVDFKRAGQYETALEMFMELLATAPTPERITPLAVNIAGCHQQRGRFGLAVQFYEKALAGRFNVEDERAEALGKLMLARQNRFLDAPPPDPEPTPEGAEGTETSREGGGVTEREPVKLGDSGKATDLFKGKLAHLMVGWEPQLMNGDTFDGDTFNKTVEFQRVTGLTETGEGDASTWHALDSFTKADVPFSIVGPLFERVRGQVRLMKTDPVSALPQLRGSRDEAAALELTEIVKNTEALIGRAFHRLSQFNEAIDHYTLYLPRVIPEPTHYGFHVELLRKARERIPDTD
jgi:peptidoglycan hydrolase-like protein with peptidoglycan-binding domain